MFTLLTMFTLITLFTGIMSIVIILVYKKYTAGIMPQNLLNKLTVIDPVHTVFAFDLHEVVLQVDSKAIIARIWHNFPTYLLRYFIMHPLQLYKVLRQVTKPATPEHTYDLLAQSYPVLAKFKPLLLDLIDMQQLNFQATALLADLKNRGYKLYILSNIWPTSLRRLFEKFPELKKLFDGYVIPDAANNYLFKPNLNFYNYSVQYIKSRNQAHATAIIFVDENYQNIKAARQAGLHAIRFNTAKKLVAKLNHIGFTDGTLNL